MAAKILKYAAIPAAAVVGLGSLRIYSISENKNEELISPRELSIYTPDAPAVQCVEEQPGLVQTGLGSVRVGLQPYVRAVQNGFTSAKVGVISVFQAGQDTYHFLRDPPPGFLPRVGIISVSGLAGLILARKGSRLKRIVVPLGLATAGTAVCYPTQTVGALKITGKKVYTVSSSIASVFKPKPKEDAVMSAVNLESAAIVTSPNTESPAKALSELTPEPPAVPEENVTPIQEVVPSEELTPMVVAVSEDAVEPPSVVDVASEIAASPSEPETVPEPVPEAESTPEPSSEPVVETVKESSPEPLLPEPVVESVPEAPAADSVMDTAPEASSESVPEDVPVPVVITEEATPSTTSTVEEATPPVVVSEDASPAIVDEEPASVAPPPAEETVPLTPPTTKANQPTADDVLPSSAAPLAEPAAVKSRFVPDPSLLDHGQSNPEDADMYSTRS